MTVETVTYLDDLDKTYPAAGDYVKEGDDHIRNIKKAIENSLRDLVDIPPLIVGYLQAEYVTYTTSSTIMPGDNTIPQITEGVELFSESYTPKNANNILIIDAIIFGGASGAEVLIAALFEDGAANAIAASGGAADTNGLNESGTVVLRHVVAAGSVSARTYAVRVGASQSGGVAYINGSLMGGTPSRVLGGVGACHFQITEIQQP